PPCRAKRVEALVGGDPVEPCAHRGALLETGEAAPGGEQRVLQCVLGVLERSEHAVTVRVELAPMRIGQLPERLAVSGTRLGEHIGCRGATRHHVLHFRGSRKYRHRSERELGARFSGIAVSTRYCTTNPRRRLCNRGKRWLSRRHSSQA